MADDARTAPANDAAGTPVLQVDGVRRMFTRPHGDPLVVLESVNLSLRRGEIVGLLGRSGSGKSTLLRIVAGLIQPSDGHVVYRNQRLDGPADGIAMVFQSFALFPWLTVLENVEAGLEAQGVAPHEMRERALAAIDIIGLDGFANAYPRELSGGMRQRVGFARALVMDPTVLLMDEPFSALDVLTAETLRTDFLDLWTENALPIQSVLLVTHNIEEAVFMCDRILLFSSNPGRVIAEIEVPFKHPRNRLDPRFRYLVDDIYARMTARSPVDQPAAVPTIGERLTEVSTNLLAGLIESLAAPQHGGRADMPEIARTLALEVDELFPIAETLQLLGYAHITHGDLILTPLGHDFAHADTQDRKDSFARQLISRIPLAAHIKNVLDERPNHRAPAVRFLSELEDYLSDSAAEETLSAVTRWGRYAELFSYDDDAETFSLEQDAE
ncbi:MAG: nitrate/sulfonate/bicarbonate ABC transporter ATP-binding protein [Nevskiaceae bacterium]|nr:MAG: nitrate/sulfonate/bicarbonate ABC transporter ATP-binding protein [Nevskiaceae bacterium]TBR71876.1 MAG: nitrate/sulfonate/bicarbonate ABC transporter ATP-binding protein [Nevskiaceae bacterium]